MVWLETKNGDFSVKSFYSFLLLLGKQESGAIPPSQYNLELLGSCKSQFFCLESKVKEQEDFCPVPLRYTRAKRCSPIYEEYHLESLRTSQGEFFRLESIMGKDLNIESGGKEGVVIRKQMFPLPHRRRNHKLHSTSLRQGQGLVTVTFCSLWHVLGLILDGQRDSPQFWHGSFVGKQHKKTQKATPLCIFWMVQKERNRLAFDNEEFSIQRLKNSFVCTLQSWKNMYITDGPLPLITFFYWLSIR